MDKFRLAGYVDSIGELLTGIADSIWDYVETAFEEYQSAVLLKETLNRQGLRVEPRKMNKPG